MDLFTRENIGNYTSDPYAKNKAQGGVVDWNYILNDMM